jgi:hypothetical protein
VAIALTYLPLFLAALMSALPIAAVPRISICRFSMT